MARRIRFQVFSVNEDSSVALAHIGDGPLVDEEAVNSVDRLSTFVGSILSAAQDLMAQNAPPREKVNVQRFPMRPITALEFTEQMKCAICLEQFEENEQVTELPCKVSISNGAVFAPNNRVTVMFAVWKNVIELFICFTA